MAKKMVIVLGLKGAGKSSIIESVAGNRNYKVVNIGGIMFELAKKKGLVKDKDKIRYLSPEIQTDLRDMAAERVGKMSGNVILDTHAAVEQHGRFFPGLNHYLLKHFGHIVGLFYIDAENKHIISRRRRDKTRFREEEDAWLINMQRDVNLAIMSYLASDLNIPLYIMDNKEGQLEKTRTEFKKHLRDAFGV